MCEFLKNQMYTETVIGTNHKLGGYYEDDSFSRRFNHRCGQKQS